MRRAFQGAFVALVLAAPGFATTDNTEPPPDPDLGTNITAIAAFDGRLFALGGPQRGRSLGGPLVSFDLRTGTRKVEAKDIAKLTKASGHLWAVAITGGPDKFHVRLLAWQTAAFAVLSEFDAAMSQVPLALVAIDERPTVFTLGGIRQFDGSAWHDTPTARSDPQEFWGIAAAATPSSARYLYLGFDRGEWGGGLKRVDIKTGVIEEIEDRGKSAGGFGTILTKDLDPVNALIADPEQPDCVIAAVGLIHFMSSGRLLRICGNKVSVILDKKTTTAGHDDVNEAFFGLSRAPGGYWAVSNVAIYRFGTQPGRYPFAGANY